MLHSYANKEDVLIILHQVMLSISSYGHCLSSKFRH